ncbi:hypothetical protein PHLH8_20840 [Pseudomonas sp. Pc102]|uniref:hypothetical protein n=1 Tax=Pseudomonas sp. Pc102 TaxID=2678261 RepID=UPI001BCAB021|nr:hypothetical protein [Pseudomonas sp. Pc102]BBP82442.1 hypothetical protein PHLH8_20840 [Pseudomonas sp. Pc102]
MMPRRVRANLARVLLTFLLIAVCLALAAVGNPFLALAIFVLCGMGLKPEVRHG